MVASRGDHDEGRVEDQDPTFCDEVRAAVLHAEVGTLDHQRHMAAADDPPGLADAVLAFTTAHD